ncbi:MAG: zinc ribbon domain-containing protein [Alcanivoracaceae bacterium]|nr:zinc ribbon domain-containing protein [Alcanivoracaceae bacterium]
MKNLSKWSCPKCSNNQYETDQFRATGGMFSKIFDIQNKHFTTVSCSRCTFTELYKTKSSNLENIFDFFVS